MPAYLSPSQLASQKAAASLAVDDGEDGTPYHDARPIARLPIDDEDAVTFAPVQPRAQQPAKPRAVCPPLSSTAAEAANRSYNADSGAAWAEVRRSSPSPGPATPSGVAGSSTHNSRRGTRVDSIGGTHGGSPQHPRSPRTPRSSIADRRQIERLALPRDEQGSVVKPAEPNYGRVLNFTEEEERQRQQQREQLQEGRRSPRTPRGPTTPRAERARAASALAPPPRHEARPRQAPAPAPMTAAQVAYLEKLAAPKKPPPTPTEVGNGAPPRRTPSTAAPAGVGAAGPQRGGSSAFDRLAAPKRVAAAPLDESTPPPSHRPRSHSSNAPASVQQQRQDHHLSRLSQPKQRATSAHRDPGTPAECVSGGPRKRYYGGTTMIAVPTSTAGPGGLPPPQPHVGGGHSGRVPDATWEAVARHTERRASSTAASASLPSDPHTEGAAVPPQQVQRIASVAPAGSAAAPAASTVTLAEPVTVLRQLPLRPPTPTPAPSGDGSTQVPSAPAKRTGSKPPIVVRTRRYVPPEEEQSTDAAKTSAADSAQQERSTTPVPQPVEATRRRAGTPPVSSASPTPPASEMPPSVATATTTSAETTPHPSPAPAPPAHAAPPASSSSKTGTASPPQPAVAAVQATKRRSPLPAAAPATAPVPATAPAAAPAPPPEVEAAPTEAPAPAEAPALRSPPPTVPSPAPSTTPASIEALPAPSPAVPAAAASAAAGRGTPSSSSAAKNGLRKVTHTKPQRTKPEVLRDEDFACKLDDAPLEPRYPVIKKKPPPATKAPATKASPPARSHHPRAT
ncbi:hypothetical protein NESM_000076500 [Novymonas esmeraldas]|uniref:Uncharacterized protein n=1 Tax=Novymonas esmeraldas TaxID=1808958 RepID=A0AAW0F4Z2_9TRYP